MTNISSIVQTATATKSADLQNKIGLAVAKKQQEAAKQSGEAAVQMIQAAARVATSQVDFQA